MRSRYDSSHQWLLVTYSNHLDTMRQKKDLLREEVVASVATWQVIKYVIGTLEFLHDGSSQETGEVDVFLGFLDRLQRWRELWLRPFM